METVTDEVVEAELGQFAKMFGRGPLKGAPKS
jgi:hypothetical protein